jgi:hypothetical protein
MSVKFGGGQAHRVREGLGRHRRSLQGQATRGDRYLISAVRAGELDELFSQAAKTGSIGKARSKNSCQKARRGLNTRR